jgi:integrase
MLNALVLSEITGFALERWRSGRLAAGSTPGTVNRDLAVVKAALARAVEWGMLTTHPLAPVRLSKLDRGGVVRYLSHEEETRLRDALTARDTKRRAERATANDWRRARGYALWPEHGAYTDHLTPLVLLALNTGLRRGELFGLRWADVDVTRAVVTVQGGGAKSGQTRHVPLNSEALAVLEAWKPADAGATTCVFPSDRGEPLEDIKSAWLPLVGAAKVSAFRFHDLRHTFASKLVMAGVDLNTVRELLGHADLKMTLRYAHLAPEHKAAAVAKLVLA